MWNVDMVAFVSIGSIIYGRMCRFRNWTSSVESCRSVLYMNVWKRDYMMDRALSEPGGTRWRTGGEVKGKLANGVGSQYSHATSGRGLSSITQADAHNSAASSGLNWRPRRFKRTRPFRGKTKSGFCACAITFRTSYTMISIPQNNHVGPCSMWMSEKGLHDGYAFPSLWPNLDEIRYRKSPREVVPTRVGFVKISAGKWLLYWGGQEVLSYFYIFLLVWISALKETFIDFAWLWTLWTSAP